MAVVLYHEEMGVYLGSCWGLGFWSKLDSADQNAAVTFNDPGEAVRIMAEWDGGVPKGVRIVQITPDTAHEVTGELIYASIDACKKAGLPGWEVKHD